MKHFNKMLKMINKMKKPALAAALAMGTIVVAYKALDIIKDC